jgi:hypothetical protein
METLLLQRKVRREIGLYKQEMVIWAELEQARQTPMISRPWATGLGLQDFAVVFFFKHLGRNVKL